MPLTDKQIKAFRPDVKAKKYFDGAGLYLEVAPGGGKWWRFKYRYGGKEKRISLGVYPAVSLKDARDAAANARLMVRDGIDPSARKRGDTSNTARTFRVVGEEWYAKQSQQWTAHHRETTLSRLNRLVYPRLGRLPVDAVGPQDILTLCRAVETGTSVYMGHVILSLAGRIMRYAVASGYIASDPSRDLAGALTPHRHTHFPAITDPALVGRLAIAIDGYNGQFTTRCALQLLLLSMVRTKELRWAEWGEIDWQDALWRIPAARMKMRREHIVPLARQTLGILRTLQTVTGHGRLLFPGRRSPARPMSENTINAALRYMGYDSSEVVGHGFRSTASTLLNEQGWPSEAIERQLAHVDGNQVRAAYNRAAYLEERRRMMQAWADYLDRLRERVPHP